MSVDTKKDNVPVAGNTMNEFMSAAKESGVTQDVIMYAAGHSQQMMVNAMTESHVANMKYLTNQKEWPIYDTATGKTENYKMKTMNWKDKKYVEDLDTDKFKTEFENDETRKTEGFDMDDWIRVKKAEKYLGMTLEQFKSADILMLTAVLQACDLVRQNFRKLG